MTHVVLGVEAWAETHAMHFAALVGGYSVHRLKIVDHLERMPDEEVQAVLAQALIDTIVSEPAIFEAARQHWTSGRRLAPRGLLFALIHAWDTEAARREQGDA